MGRCVVVTIMAPKCWHPSGVRCVRASLRWSAPFAPADHRLPSANPAGWLPVVGYGQSVRTPTSFRAALESGSAGLVNPKGCQRVAGGRRGFGGRRPPGNGAARVPYPGRGARLVAAEPDRDWRCHKEPNWHPFGVRDHPMRFPGGRPPFGPADHRLPSTNPAGWPPSVSSGQSGQTLTGFRACPGVWQCWVSQPEGLPEGSRRLPGIWGPATSG